MELTIVGWASRGLRCPDIDIRLADAQGASEDVTLIQMPNGTGKTTTLRLLRAALTGEGTFWTRETIQGFRRASSTEIEGLFVLDLRIDDRPLTFELRFDFEEGGVAYRTTNPAVGGLQPGWHPPSEAGRYLTEAFVSLFVFDGELAEQLLDPSLQEAASAIDALCQLHLLDEVYRAADDEWKRATQSGGAKTQQGLKACKTKLSKLDKRCEEIRKVRRELTKEQQTLDQSASTLRNEVNKHLGRQQSDRDKLAVLEEISAAKGVAVGKEARQLMELLRLPHLADRGVGAQLLEFKDHLDKLRLPESSSKQFFEELASEDDCVCGRPLTDAARRELRDRAKQFMGSEITGVLNTVKSDIDKFIRDSELTAEDVADAESSLLAASEGLRGAKQEVRVMKDRLLEESSADVRRKQDRLEELKGRLKTIEDSLTEISRERQPGENDESLCLKAVEHLRNAAKEKVSTITGTVELGQRTAILQRVVKDTRELARARIRAALVTESNRRLSTVLVHDPIQIKDINRSIELADQEGASMGQTLAVGYTFLASLFSRGSHVFPLVVDSPVISLDATVRGQVAELIQNLKQQFIAFTISTERTGFVPELDRLCNVRYLTLFRRTKGTRYLEKRLPGSGVTQTDAACLVEGKEYFFAFDLDAEE